MQYGPELPMQCSICRAGHKPIPAAQDRGWNHINPSSLQNLNVAPRTGTLCPREYWSRMLRGSPWAALKEILACLEGWGIHLQPSWRKSTFMAGWAATAVVSKEGWKKKNKTKNKRTVSPYFISVGFNCILFTCALTEKWGTQYRDLNPS